MDDLETQLRRYADQIEDAVGEVPVASHRPAPPSMWPTSSRRSPLLLTAAVVAVALIGAAALLLSGDDTATGPAAEAEPAPDDRAADTGSLPVDEVVLIDAPDTIGLDIDGARQLLLAAGLMFEVEFEANSDFPANQVFGQDPHPGQRVEPGVSVELRVSSGAQETVPSLVGMTQEPAILLLQGLGYRFGIRVEPSLQPRDTVIDQDPAPGATLAPGELVELVVSGGAEVVPVPDVRGLDVVEAIDALGSAGLRFDTEPTLEPSADVPPGRVIRTEPGAGTLVAEGVVVRIVVSAEPDSIEVPMVVDLFADTAIITLRLQGLEVVTVFETVPVGSPSIGRVIRQSPDAFSELAAGSIVTITVGESFPQATTTTTTTIP